MASSEANGVDGQLHRHTANVILNFIHVGLKERRVEPHGFVFQKACLAANVEQRSDFVVGKKAPQWVVIGMSGSTALDCQARRKRNRTNTTGCQSLALG